jgi:hypothetical protein
MATDDCRITASSKETDQNWRRRGSGQQRLAHRRNSDRRRIRGSRSIRTTGSEDLGDAAAQAAAGLLDLGERHRAQAESPGGERRSMRVSERRRRPRAHPHLVAGERQGIADEGGLLRVAQPQNAGSSGDEVDRDLLRAGRLALAVVGAGAEALASICRPSTRTRRSSARAGPAAAGPRWETFAAVKSMARRRSGRRHAGAAADAGRGVHRQVGVLLGDRDRVGVGRAAGVDRDVAAGLR